jgi:hypothetical protein
MKLREEFNRIPKIPVKKWYYSEGLNEIEKVYFDEMKGLEAILEIGSGTNALKRKFYNCGFEGSYDTMDLSREFPQDYHSLKEIRKKYDGIVILEVIEHMSLDEFWELLTFIETHLTPEGKVALSTAHAGSIVPWESWDLTHIQQYPLHDLYALFRSHSFSAKCFRVWCQRPRVPFKQKIRLLLRKLFCYILGVDYTHSVAMILKKEPIVQNDV